MDDGRRRRSRRWSILTALAVAVAIAGTVQAEPISLQRVLSNVDWTSSACSGVGSSGQCTINVNDVSGSVTAAYLYWHGIDNSSASAVYDNPTVTFNSSVVTGTALGDATTNCWGDGSSRAFEADVTALVGGNGSYTITGMSSGFGHNANGASLVVVFNDGDTTNNRDLVFFTGNDSNVPQGFPGEDEGWNASLPGIDYRGGPVAAELHAADGQSFPDSSLTFSTVNGSRVEPDVSGGLWDGISVPSAGSSRATNGQLWDVHMFDITPAFGGVAGEVTLNVNGQTPVSDCLGLVLMLMDLEPFSAPGGCPDDLDPTSQGYWHRQCLGMPAGDSFCPGIDPGREGRGPDSPTESNFCPTIHDCAQARLEELGFYGVTTCEGMDANPPSDPCEKALKQLTAAILNECSDRTGDGCEVDLTAYGCTSTTVGDAILEVADRIHAGDCTTASACAAALNEGDAFSASGTAEAAMTIGMNDAADSSGSIESSSPHLDSSESGSRAIEGKVQKRIRRR